MWNATKFSRRVGIQYPIVQGPFGGGPSSVKLLAAVSNAGGLGSYGMHALEPQRMRALITEIRAATDKPFAVNLWVANEDHPQDDEASAFQQGLELLEPLLRELELEPPRPPERYLPALDEQLEVVLETRPRVFSFVYGIPKREFLSACRAQGTVTMGTATTPEEALMLQSAGVDCIVASGPEAGGHRGSFLEPAEKSLVGMIALLPQVADLVTVPFIAAGGIADARGIAAAFALGAHGVQIGSAFLACEESDASDLHRASLLGRSSCRTGLSRAFTGRLSRGMRNTVSETLEAHPSAIPRYPVQSWLVGQLKIAAIRQGREDLLSFAAGQATPLIRHKKAAELMAELTRDVPRVLAALRP